MGSIAEELKGARSSLKAGDLLRAAHHLGGVVGMDPANESLPELVRLFLGAAGQGALAQVPVGAEVFHGTAALRAWLLFDLGRETEALTLLLQVIAAVPSVPYSVWLERWALSPEKLDRVDPEGLARAVEDLDRSFGSRAPADAEVAQAKQRLLALLREALARHPASPSLFLATCTATRASGQVDEALAMADARVRERPDYAAFAAIGDAYRDAGHLEDAIGAYMQALQREPDQTAVRVALGDLSMALKRERGALAAFEGVLARAPEDERALPAVHYLRYRVRGDDAARAALEAYVASHPQNERARQLRDRVFPFVHALPPRVESLIGIAAELWRRGPSGGRLPAIALAALEAPSAVASFHDTLAAVGAKLAADILVEEIPEPDPRKPVVEVLFVPWRYDDGPAARAVPVPAPPAPDVSASVAELAVTAYGLEDWWAAARSLEPVREGRLDDLLAVMVHPPPRPEGVTPWEWRFRVQVAAAYGVANLREGWPGVRRRALYALTVGPVDWTAEAAIAALTELALREEAARKDVVTLFGRLLELPLSPIRLECIFRPLVACLPRIPRLPEPLLARLSGLRTEVDALEAR